MNKKIITGHWDGQPIWRYQTPEEKLREAGLTEEQGKLFELYNELIRIQTGNDNGSIYKK